MSQCVHEDTGLLDLCVCRCCDEYIVDVHAQYDLWQVLVLEGYL